MTSNTNRVQTAGGLSVATALHQFITQEALPGTGVEADHFFSELAAILSDLAPRNQSLLDKRDALQTLIDDWHAAHPAPIDAAAYKAFLEEIGYLEPAVDDFRVDVDRVDDEIARIAGPQLVVPVNNARYALNAANARWGSLYDALYGTDVIDDADGAERGGAYNPVRGDKVIAYANDVLDRVAALDGGQHREVTGYAVVDGTLHATLTSGAAVGLQQAATFRGYRGDAAAPDTLLLRHNGLHVEVQIDPEHPIGKASGAGVKDVLMEAALSTIQDCEDSVAAVDADDKVVVYRNWLGLMKGDLQEP